MTTKTVAVILAAMWGLSTILATIITVIVPIDIIWPVALVDWDVLYNYTLYCNSSNNICCVHYNC